MSHQRSDFISSIRYMVGDQYQSQKINWKIFYSNPSSWDLLAVFGISDLNLLDAGRRQGFQKHHTLSCSVFHSPAAFSQSLEHGRTGRTHHNL